MKGIILAGGANTRLLPVTAGVSKQLLPVYDKPMIYYPLSVLMLAGIREILVISTPRDTPRFEAVLRDGAELGLRLSYAVQEQPRGIAQAFILARDFLAGGACALALGDNILFGHGLTEELADAVRRNDGATIFGYEVEDPARYGVVTLDPTGRPTAIDEKPRQPRSNWAVIGLYLYDGRVAEVAAGLQASDRGELEITDINRWYLAQDALKVRRLGRGYAWIDAGTFESLHEAATFVRTIQRRQGYLIACVEEVAFRMGYIDAAQLREHAGRYVSSDYGRYLRRLLA